jgi:hypothetical protein
VEEEKLKKKSIIYHSKKSFRDTRKQPAKVQAVGGKEFHNMAQWEQGSNTVGLITHWCRPSQQ